MANIVTGVLVDVTRTGKVGKVVFEDTIENIYKLLDVDLIDVATRKVGDKVYDFVVDDEGLLKGGAIPSVFDNEQQPMLVGNALILNCDDEGNFASLTDDDFENLQSHLGRITFYDENREEDRTALVISGAEYC